MPVVPAHDDTEFRKLHINIVHYILLFPKRKADNEKFTPGVVISSQLQYYIIVLICKYEGEAYELAGNYRRNCPFYH